MIWALALAVWALLAAGTYLLLSRDLLRCVIGLSLLGTAVNLLLLGVGRSGSVLPPIVLPGQATLGAAANALPQALVLTAIVIGLALTAFSLVLVMQLVRSTEVDDVLALRWAEPEPQDPVKPPVIE